MRSSVPAAPVFPCSSPADSVSPHLPTTPPFPHVRRRISSPFFLASTPFPLSPFVPASAAASFLSQPPQFRVPALTRRRQLPVALQNTTLFMVCELRIKMLAGPIRFSPKFYSIPSKKTEFYQHYCDDTARHPIRRLILPIRFSSH